MNETLHTLDEALSALPRDAESSRDLWPRIRAEIESGSRRNASAPLWGMWGQIAAGIVLMVASSAITYVVTRNSTRQDAETPQVAAVTNFGDALGSEYLQARADLDRLFAERMASLPPATRAKLQNNLNELRHAADEITATLAAHPSDSLLQELLLSTRQRELQLLADVSRIPIPNS